jgi:hypothetical protein
MPEYPLASTLARQRHHRADRACRERRIDTRRMTAKQITLQIAERVPGNLHFRQRAEAGIDSVDRGIGGSLAIDDMPRGVDGGCGRRRHRDLFVTVCDGEQLRQGE